MESRWAHRGNPRLLSKPTFLWVTQNPTHLLPSYLFRTNFLGRFPQKMRKVTNKFVISVRPHISEPLPPDRFLEILYFVLSPNFVVPLRFRLTWNKRNRHMTWPACMYDLSRWLVFVTEKNSVLCVVRADASDGLYPVWSTRWGWRKSWPPSTENALSNMSSINVKDVRLQIFLLMKSRLRLILNVC